MDLTRSLEPGLEAGLGSSPGLGTRAGHLGWGLDPGWSAGLGTKDGKQGWDPGLGTGLVLGTRAGDNCWGPEQGWGPILGTRTVVQGRSKVPLLLRPSARVTRVHPTPGHTRTAVGSTQAVPSTDQALQGSAGTATAPVLISW